jgi:NAD(P)-dependent dehydrogenase (short-subunit alcohol dehydrogenase family)
MADVPHMAGKSVLVTGGTSGIGRATAIGLAALGARVGITGRDPARTEAAAAGIRAAPGSPAVDAFAADLSVQAGVRRLAAQVLDTYPRLDVLVNNAGGFWAHRHVTADGLERTFALNHLAPFLLTSLLLDRLTASARSSAPANREPPPAAPARHPGPRGSAPPVPCRALLRLMAVRERLPRSARQQERRRTETFRTLGPVSGRLARANGHAQYQRQNGGDWSAFVAMAGQPKRA